MTQVIWSPAPGVLFAEPETARGVAYQISCSVVTDPAALEPAPTVTEYRASLAPQPGAPVLQVGTDDGGISVTSDALAGLFGIEFIDYRIGERVVRIHSWDDLPDSAEEIIEYRPSGTAERAYTLNATAWLSDGTKVSAAYQCVVQQEWTAGRDRLKGEVDARRS